MKTKLSLIISIVVLTLSILLSLYLIGYQMTVKPMIEMYSLYGLRGSVIYFICEILLFVVMILFLKLVRWAADNLFL